jgi:hypothetical protein
MRISIEARESRRLWASIIATMVQRGLRHISLHLLHSSLLLLSHRCCSSRRPCPRWRLSPTSSITASLKSIQYALGKALKTSAGNVTSLCLIDFALVVVARSADFDSEVYRYCAAVFCEFGLLHHQEKPSCPRDWYPRPHHLARV